MRLVVRSGKSGRSFPALRCRNFHEKVRRVVCKRNKTPNGKKMGICEVPLQLSVMKIICPRCLLGLYGCMLNSSDTMQSGFKMTEIDEAIETDIESEDSLEDLNY